MCGFELAIHSVCLSIQLYDIIYHELNITILRHLTGAHQGILLS
jgi:hypothetical protein